MTENGQIPDVLRLFDAGIGERSAGVFQ